LLAGLGGTQAGFEIARSGQGVGLAFGAGLQAARLASTSRTARRSCAWASATASS
jgi:hypothetical protein